jgi:hypothetical protein
MRAIRRQLRAWREEFLQLWGRLRSFHRVSLGIILAFAMLSLAQRYGFSVLKSEIAKARETLEEKEVPDFVTRPEDDPDTQELQLRVESFEETLAARRSELEKAVAAWPRFTKADQGTILAKFNELITEAGLQCLTFRDAALPLPEEARSDSRRGSRGRRPPPAKPVATDEKTKAKEPLETAVHSCVLAGSFDGICDFLEKVDRFEHPARLEKVHLELADAATQSEEESPAPPIRPNEAPVIHLSFELKLYLSD